MSRRKRPGYVEPMEKEALQALHTGTLLTRLDALRSLHESVEASDYSDEELRGLGGVILFKNTEIWRKAIAEVKAVLAEREHMTRGSREARRQNAYAKKHR